MLIRVKTKPRQRIWMRTQLPLLGTYIILMLVLGAGCAKYNTYFNAKRAFDNAEHIRDEAIRQHQDPPKPGGQQKTDYETAIRKAQKILDDYPGNGLIDDSLFLQAKAWHRLESYRMSIRKLDLLFTNYPKTEYMEEALYLQGLNHLLIGSLVKSQEYLDRLEKLFPKSKYQAETRKVIGDNAYAMKDWETALKSYREYLGQKSGVQDPDRIGVKLGECCWELHLYADAIPVLDTVVKNTLSNEISFSARLLKARILTHLERYDEATALLDEIRPEAEVFRSQGMVTLVDAENLYAQGKGAEATPILENMPADWNTPDVKARVADLLGHQFMIEGKWEEAKGKFQEALRNKEILDDQDETRRLNSNLNDYLVAQTALKDATGERVPRLKLLKANALLFGMERPGKAAHLYEEAAADTAADPGDAARALFGAIVAYRDHLDRPDSAAIYTAELLERYPDSPQAFEVSSDKGGRDLLEYLLDRRSEIQRENYAELSSDERAALESVDASDDQSGTVQKNRGPGIRRRMVYLSRRMNLHYEPPQRVLPLQSRISGMEAPAGSATPGDVPFEPISGPLSGPGFESAGSDTSGNSMIGPQGPVPLGEKEIKKKEELEKAKKKKKKQSDSWDLLRSPQPGSMP